MSFVRSLTPTPTPTWTRARRPALAGVLMVAAALGGGPARAQSLLIDGFDAPRPARASVFTGEAEAAFNDFTATVPGGVRGLYHHTYTNPLSSVAALAWGDGLLSSSTGVGARSEVVVSYGAFTRPTGDDAVGGPLLGLDATPFNAFRLDFTGASDVLNLIVVLYTANPLDPAAPLYYSTAAGNFFPAEPGGPMEVLLPFSLGDAFNFGQVDGIVLLIDRANNATGVSFNLDSFSLVSSVPEPSPAAMLAAGMALVGWMLRRQRPGGAIA
jgi:hypothetical protein